MSNRYAVFSVLAISVFVSTMVRAAPPWHALVPFKRIDADPQKAYSLSQENGPWMIVATTFAGPGADRDAHELVLALRKEYKLEAYVHKQRFDFTKPEVGLGLNRYGGPKRMRHLSSHAFDEWAVLVGNFPSVNDAGLEKTLKKLKYAKPKVLTGTTTQRFAGLRAIQRRITGDAETKKKGPMGNSFVTRNPVLPQDYMSPNGIDKFVYDMNRGIKHSLLDCPAKYTVQVATFRGNVIIDQKQIEDINQGVTDLDTRLDAAALKAHRLTKALREKGVEAYEFHDRNESIVTIGNFEAVGSPRGDGKTEINPAVHQIMQSYGARQQQIPGVGNRGLQPVQLDGIPFDVQPFPVEVPRYSRGNDYAKN